MAPANAWSTSFLPPAADRSSPPPPNQLAPPPPTLPASPAAPPTRNAAAAAALLAAAAAAASSLAGEEEEEGCCCCCCCLLSTSKPGERDRPLGKPPFDEEVMAALLPKAALTICPNRAGGGGRGTVKTRNLRSVDCKSRVGCVRLVAAAVGRIVGVHNIQISLGPSHHLSFVCISTGRIRPQAKKQQRPLPAGIAESRARQPGGWGG